MDISILALARRGIEIERRDDTMTMTADADRRVRHLVESREWREREGEKSISLADHRNKRVHYRHFFLSFFLRSFPPSRPSSVDRSALVQSHRTPRSNFHHRGSRSNECSLCPVPFIPCPLFDRFHEWGAVSADQKFHSEELRGIVCRRRDLATRN